MNLLSIPNFCDCGGLPTVDGRQLRHGRLFRAEAIATPTPEDAARLDALPLSLVCDLRSSAERAQQASPYLRRSDTRLLTGPDQTHGHSADMAVAMRKVAGEGAQAVATYMTRSYAQLPEQFAEGMRELLKRLADGEGPVLVHCAAGKDRTGVVCALIQHALGVSEPEIHRDYHLSDTHFGAARLNEVMRTRYGSVLPADVVDMMRVRAVYFDASFDAITTQYGTVDAYLHRVAGLTDAQRQALQHHLLEHSTAD